MSRRPWRHLRREDKSLRNRLALRLTQRTRPGRFGRLLLVLAWAYWQLVGLPARLQYGPACWCGTTPERRPLAVRCVRDQPGGVRAAFGRIPNVLYWDRQRATKPRG